MNNTDDKGRAARIEVVMRPTANIRPNDWNPNRMEKDEFAQLVEAVKAARALAKPLVVCPAAEGGHVVVDGEHAFRAAELAGLKEVPCQVLELDEFGMMRETHVRNIHGRPHPVLRGRMFERMLTLRGLSNRELAPLVGVSEGTVRNAREYAQAAEVRHRHAAAIERSQEETDDEIGALTVHQVRAYLATPDETRDAWLDSGCPADAPALGQAPATPGRGGAGGGARRPRSLVRRDKRACTPGGRRSGTTGTAVVAGPVAEATADRPPPDSSSRKDAGAPYPPGVALDHDALDDLMVRMDGFVASGRADDLRAIVRRLLGHLEVLQMIESELAARRAEGQPAGRPAA